MIGKCNSCLREREKPSFIKANVYKPKKHKPYREKKAKIKY